MIRRHQQGGQMTPEQVQQQVSAMVEAAFVQGDPEAQKAIEQIMQAAQQGDPQATQIAQMIQAEVSKLQGQARSQKFGGHLAYIHKLRTGVSANEEITYHREGGKVKKVVSQKACGGVKLKVENGGEAPKKNSKKETYFECKGGKAKKVASAKKCYFGGNL